jgi:hypothetical protein
MTAQNLSIMAIVFTYFVVGGTAHSQVNFVDTFYFEQGVASLDAQTLVKVKKLLAFNFQNVSIMPIHGSEDSISVCYENNIYQRRAENVKCYLVSHKMDSTMVQIIHDRQLEYNQPESIGLCTIYIATKNNKHKGITFNEISWAIQIE